MTGQPHIRLDQIAARAGVSVATVSRALRGSPNISRVTRDAVEQARDALRAELSGGAQRPVFGVIAGRPAGASRAPGQLDPHFAQILAGVEAACLGLGAVPYPWQHSEALAEHGEAFLAGLAGAIVVGGVVEPAVIDLLAARGIPTVVAGGHVYRQRVNSVAPDYQQGAYLLTSHLLSLGHRRVVLFPGPSVSHSAQEKLAGYLLAHAEHGVIPDRRLVRVREGYQGFRTDVAARLTEEWLDGPDAPGTETPAVDHGRPTAAIYATDPMARAGLDICLRRGLRVPEQLSVAGFHDDPPSREAAVPLTTVGIDRVLTGAVATERLQALRREASRAPVVRQLLPVELILRHSTAAPPS